MTNNSKIYVLGGSKGGVGKSLASMALLDFLTHAKGAKPFLVETDTSNPDVFKCYKDAVDSELLDLDELDGWLELLSRCSELTQKQSRVLVVNSAARNNTAVTRFGERLAMGLDELNIELITIWLISEQRDSLELLKQYREALPNSVVHVVRNEYFGTRFELYNSSDMRRDVEARGGRSLTLSSLAHRVIASLYGERLTMSRP
jgi:hypothetical protein